MGEIADDHMDRFFERMFDRYDGGDEHEPHRSRGLVCRRCGAEGLFWLPLNRGQYLLKNHDGSQHVCPPAGVDEFDVVA